MIVLGIILGVILLIVAMIGVGGSIQDKNRRARCKNWKVGDKLALCKGKHNDILEHNKTKPLGKLVEWSQDDTGITASFRIAKTNAGNDALEEAATGLAPRRGYLLDAMTVLVGNVLAGARGRPAETRTGAARLLTTNLAAQNTWKLVAYGQSSNSAGGYILQAAHVAEGAALSAASAYANIGVITIGTGQSNPNEVVVGGKQIRDAVRVAGSVTGDVTTRTNSHSTSTNKTYPCSCAIDWCRAA